MGKTLDERITSARSTDRITITDLQALIPEVRDEIERQRGVQAAAESDSTDLALSQTDQDSAAATAERAGRLAKSYAQALGELETKLRDKVESEKRKAAEAKRAAAIAKRDEIAGRFKTVVPEAIAKLTTILADVLENAAEMKKLGLRELDAEFVARGLKGHYIGYTPVSRLTEMKIPSLDGKSRTWPPERPNIDFAAAKKQGRRNVQEWNAKREAAWCTVSIRPNRDVGHVTFKARVAPDHQAEKTVHLVRVWEGQIQEREVERLRSLGIQVDALDPAELAAKRAARAAAG